MHLYSLRKTVRKRVTKSGYGYVTQSDFERSNISLNENKPDCVDPNSNDLDYWVRKNEEKNPWFSAHCLGYYNLCALCKLMFDTIHYVTKCFDIIILFYLYKFHRNFMKLDLFTTNPSLKTQSSYSNSLMSPLNLSRMSLL